METHLSVRWGPDQSQKQHFAPVPLLDSLSVSEPYRISYMDNYSVRTAVLFTRSEFPKVCGRWGEKEGNFPFVWTHLVCDSALKRDYIITIVASEPSAFLHWLAYSGPSDPDKDRAFQQFNKQETQTRSHTSLQPNSSTP